MRKVIGVLVVVFAVGAFGVAQAPADSTGVSAKADAAAGLSPIAVTPVAVPQGVPASDGKLHLAYELAVVNQISAPVEITALTVSSGKGTELAGLTGAALTSVLALLGGAPGSVFGPGAAGYLFVDLTLPDGAPVPRTLRHTFDLTIDPANASAPPQTTSFTGVPVRVDRAKPVVVAAPLRGSGWVAGNGCCTPPTAHRGATLSIDGTVHVAERFAIDFVQLGPNGAMVQGDRTVNEDYGYFGDKIHSVAAGTVVNVQDGQAEQTPGALPEDQTVQTAGGNFVVVDIGNGNFAFYAHMQPESITVKVGDAVKSGQALGLLGNTGNTDGAHLHFHIMDGPSPLRSNGVPFVFKKFTGEGLVTDEAALLAGQPAPVDTTVSPGVHRNEMPLNLEVMRFGG